MKIIGSILIILSSVISSYYYEKGLKESIEKVRALIDLITYIKMKIEYYSISVDDILQEYRSNDHWINSNMQDRSFEIKHVEISLKNDISTFFSSLGKGYKKEQISLCDYTLSRLLESYEIMKKEYVNKAKIYRSLSLFGGIGVVILLI